MGIADKGNIALTPSRICDPTIAIAATRAGALGILDAGPLASVNRAEVSLAYASLAEAQRKPGTWGIRLEITRLSAGEIKSLADLLSPKPPILVLAGLSDSQLKSSQAKLTGLAENLIVETGSLKNAIAAQNAAYDGVILKGNESGGQVGDLASFILLQKCHGQLNIPYWIQGGIGPHTAVAAQLAGANGVVLSEQLWMTRESPFSDEQMKVWRGMDGGETNLVQSGKTLNRVCPARYLRDTPRSTQAPTEPESFPLGQEIAFAAWHADHYGTTGRVLSAYQNLNSSLPALAAGQSMLSRDSAMAKSHGTAFPITQGPMSQVSDSVNFVVDVAQSGALAFLGLSALPVDICRERMQETAERLPDTPWGVGLLGFLSELFPKQLKEVLKIKPPYALISGGTPAQVAELEAEGIKTYLHIPSPRLLDISLKQGVRRIVFEGGECGGHVGPRSSFTLWEEMVERLLDSKIEKPESLHILFAGGIHDDLSAAMVALLAAPLVERGFKCGIQMGSAYLLTDEAISSGAIVPTYQEKALQSEHTIVLDSGLGHANRCLKSPYTDEFLALKQQLEDKGLPVKEIREQLENMNMGRLGIATRGTTIKFSKKGSDEKPRIVRVDVKTQTSKGMYSIGEATTFHDKAFSNADLHNSISKLGDQRVRAYVTQTQSAQSKTGTRARVDYDQDIAIIGMACIYPGAQNSQEYWANIVHGLDFITEVKDERWRASDFYDPDRRKADRIYSKWGGFIDDYPFESQRYGIPPTSMKATEPIQLLALETARLAMEDAGIDQLSFSRENTAVIYGVGGMQDLGIDYIFRSMLTHYLPKVSGLSDDQRQSIIQQLYDNELPEWNEDTFPGVLNNVVAGRVANRLDLNGSNYSVDAACGSSLAALDVGVQKLRSGTADMALVGAADGTNNATSFMAFSKVQAMTPSGHSRPFDESADGITIGEGIATIVIKRLADAERDGDRIYSVIKGIGSSSDGRNRSLTAPHPKGQVRAVTRAYEDANISPESIELVEAHGTGTSVGDQSEIEALGLAFGKNRDKSQYCALGSVKSMIGHTKVAAGMAGIIKSAHALNQKVLPPTNGVSKPNKAINTNDTPFYINSEPRPWLKNDLGSPRRCGVSAFGFGGTNFHVLLEEYRGRYRHSDTCNLSPYGCEILAFAGKNRKEIIAELGSLTSQITHPEYVELSQLAYSHYIGETKKNLSENRCRLVLVAKDTAELLTFATRAVQMLQDKQDNPSIPGIYFNKITETPGKLGFLFPGQGAQKVDMMRDILLASPRLYKNLEHANQTLADELGGRLSDYIYPVPAFSPQERTENQQRLNDTQIAQPALAVMNMTALDVMRSFGLEPDVVGGHSFGEYVALAAANVIPWENLYKLAAQRGRFSKEVPAAGKGTMAAIQAGEERVQNQIKALKLDVSVANINTPTQTVVAGSAESVKEAVLKMKTAGVQAQIIPVTAPFHTPLMAEASEKLAKELEKIPFSKASCVVYSNTLGTPYPDNSKQIQDILGRHISEPVRYLKQIENMYAAGVHSFIEVGPGTIQSNLVDKILAGKPHTTLQFNGGSQAAWPQLASVLGECWVAGYPVILEQWFAQRPIKNLTVKELLEQMNTRANPSPLTWRINGDKARPWKQPANKENEKTTKHKATMMGNQEEPLSVPQQATNEAPTSSANGDLVQQNIAQFIELQRAQQHTMDRFLKIQEQLMGQATGLAPATQAISARPAMAPVISAARPHQPAPVMPAIPGASIPTPVSAIPAAAEPVRPPTTLASGGNGKGNGGAPNGHDSAPTDFKSTLLAAVSERTGYPEDMLDMDANLEADLGIDSIKRAEIFSTLGQHQDMLHGVSEETLLEELTGLQTLNKILEWYQLNEQKALDTSTSEGAPKKP